MTKNNQLNNNNMKKILFFAAFVCSLGLIIGCGSGNSEKTSLEYDGIHGKAKCVKTYMYDAQVKFGEAQKGDLVRYPDHPLRVLYSDIANASISVINYNEDGMRTYVDYYDDDMELSMKSVYKFDGRRVMEVKSYDYDGELSLSITMKRDEKTGKLTEQDIESFSEYYPYKQHYTYTETDDGRITCMTSDRDTMLHKWGVKEIKKGGKIQKREQYDENDKLLFLTLFDDNERVLSFKNEATGDSTSFAYNENGDEISVVSITYEYNRSPEVALDSTPAIDTTNTVIKNDSKKRKTKEHKFEYEYDKHGNWIRRITYEGIKPIYIEEREIEYY